ncbi:MAG: response regulator [Phycisphaerae bacterium]|nr:response regulator [Phycisphaerae bacterium]
MSRPLKIIIADDEVHILRVVEFKLRAAGFDVVCAHDGLQAWQEIERDHPALLITDYQMPGINGMELAQKMFNLENLRDIPVILLTARCFSLNRDDLAKTNIVRVVPKPFSPRELLAWTQQIFSNSTYSSGA